jgi:hypothetical protein
MQPAHASHDSLAHFAATGESAHVQALSLAACGRYVAAIQQRDGHREMEFMRAALREVRSPAALRPLLVPLVARRLEALLSCVGRTAGAVSAIEILAAFLAFLLGVPLPAAIVAPGTFAAVPPGPALGVPAGHVAQLVAAGPIRA